MTTSITLDNKRYYLHKRDHRQASDPYRTSDVGLTGKTIIQDFGFTKKTWELTILVYLVNPPTGFGSMSDLQAAFAATPPIVFVDVDGSEADVILLGRLEMERSFSLVDQTAPFPVSLRLERVNT